MVLRSRGLTHNQWGFLAEVCTGTVGAGSVGKQSIGVIHFGTTSAIGAKVVVFWEKDQTAGGPAVFGGAGELIRVNIAGGAMRQCNNTTTARSISSLRRRKSEPRRAAGWSWQGECIAAAHAGAWWKSKCCY